MKVEVFSFNIVINKYATGNENTKLEGAKFVLKNNDGKYYKCDTATKAVSCCLLYTSAAVDCLCHCCLVTQVIEVLQQIQSEHEMCIRDSYIFGHDTALGIREKILEALSSYKRVECALSLIHI